MAQIQKLEVETEVKCSADQFYGMCKNNIGQQLTKFCSQSIKSFQVLEGDGNSVGSVRLWQYALGSPNHLLMGKEKIKDVDDESRSITYIIMEGDVLKFYKSFEYKVSATPPDNGDGKSSCLVKWSVEFEKDNEDGPNPDAYLGLMAVVSKELGHHLLNQA